MNLRYLPLGIAVAVCTMLPAAVTHARETIDLSGQWTVRLDPNDRGIANNWAETAFAGKTVRLPGALRESGVGEKVGPETQWIGDIREKEWNEPRYAPFRKKDNFKIPFWLQPNRHYVGPAWYQRTVDVPEDWAQQQVKLYLERPHWHTTVWVDGIKVGANDSLSTAHTYDLTGKMGPGTHRLVIRIDNSLKPINVGPNSHSVTDHTQSAWHGIAGSMQLRREPPMAITDLQVYPNAAEKSARIEATMESTGAETVRGRLRLRVTADDHSLAQQVVPVTIREGRGSVETTLSLGSDAPLWDAFDPRLCTVDAQLSSGDQHDRSKIRFGLRDIEVNGTQFVINGRKTFLRGTLECGIFPKTGYPPTDVERWKQIIQTCKNFGLNHMRFHSWCPPKAAFVAADQLGFYLQVECSSWANQGAKLGVGRPIDQWLYREADRILDAYGNHPSFVLFTYGNEPAGVRGDGDLPARGYLTQWVDHYKTVAPRQLITAGSGWPLLDNSEFHVSPEPRIHAWGAGLSDRLNGEPPATMADYRNFVERYPTQPVIAHEIGQWCVFPNFEEMDKYTGSLKPRNYEVFQHFLEQRGMADQARDFLMASGELQELCYKEEIESSLRTRGFGGFQLLDLHDFPGQGTALVGVLDAFWDPKPYVSAQAYRRFCAATVPLVRLPARNFTTGQTVEAKVEVAHYGPGDIKQATIGWELTTPSGIIVADGDFAPRRLKTGGLRDIGKLTIPLSSAPAPGKLILEIEIRGTQFSNHWPIWVFPDPKHIDEKSNIHLTRSLNQEAINRLDNGGSVMLVGRPDLTNSDVKLGFTPVFWNTAWTGDQPPHTLGLLIDADHSALAAFPTNFHTNWQWWDLIHHAAPMELGHLPEKLEPIVQVVPDWFDPKRLGLMFEAKVGPGRLLVSSIDLMSNLSNRPEARQMRRSLLQYMQSDDFNPDVQITQRQVRALFDEPTALQVFDATVQASSVQPGYEAVNVLDADPATIWHSAWGKGTSSAPHSLTLDLQAPRQLQGLSFLPRQDGHNGLITRYALYLSSDGQNWGAPVAKGRWLPNKKRKRITFDKVYRARYVRLKALTSNSTKDHASLAEVNVLLPALND
jgi:hypothetical protein